MVSFQDKILEIQVIFDNALQLSPLETQDKLVINLKNETYAKLFVSKDNRKAFLSKDFWTISGNIRK